MSDLDCSKPFSKITYVTFLVYTLLRTPASTRTVSLWRHRINRYNHYPTVLLQSLPLVTCKYLIKTSVSTDRLSDSCPPFLSLVPTKIKVNSDVVCLFFYPIIIFTIHETPTTPSPTTLVIMRWTSITPVSS